jgi:hypothetical protein
MTHEEKVNMGCGLLLVLFFIGIGIVKMSALHWDLRCLVVECRILK